jgi:signal transduction histidine kinase
MQYNIDNLKTDEEKKKFIEFLQTSTKPIDKKVNKILALLDVKSKIDVKVSINKVNVKAIFLEYMNYFKLNYKIIGDADIMISEEYMRTIVDNILSNINDKKYEKSDLLCLVNIKTEDNFLYITIEDDAKKFQNPDSVFQPFYTTKEQGIGMGMYQVAMIIEALNGTIKCLNIDSKATTIIKLPIL